MWYFVCKGLSIDDVRVSRDIAVFQEKRPEAGFETGDFAKEKLFGGGYRRTTTCLIYTCVKQGYRRTTTCLIYTCVKQGYRRTTRV